MKNMADAAPSPEKLAAMRNIRRLMAFWHIEPHELHGVPVAAVAPPLPAPPRPRYRHPISHEEWAGEGPQPEWLRQALLREGYTVEELRRCAAQTPAG